MMTGHAGIFAGGDMVPSERTVTVGVGHGKKAARHIDAWLRGERYRAAAEARAGRLRQAQHLVLRRRAEDRAAVARARAAHVDVRRGRAAASTRPTRCSRRGAACRAATASNATTATACAPTTR